MYVNGWNFAKLYKQLIAASKKHKFQFRLINLEQKVHTNMRIIFPTYSINLYSRPTIFCVS